MASELEPDRGDEDDEAPGVPIVELMGFAFGASKRHWGMGLAWALGVGVVATLFIRQLPPHFEASARVSVPPNMVVATALGRTQNIDPLKGVEDVVYRDDNLAAIVDELALVRVWDQTRPPLMHLKDQAFERVFGAIPVQEKRRAIIALVKMNISVQTGDGAITFRAEWGDAKTAFQLCQVMKRNFLSRRSGEELSAITAATTVLDEELKRAGEAIDPALAGARRARANARQAGRGAETTTAAPTAAPAMTRRAPSPAPVENTREISAKLDAVRRAASAVRDPWQRRLADLRFQLADLKATFGPEHPAVLAQEARITDASAEPPELTRLDQQERELLSGLPVSGATDEGGSRPVSRGGSVGAPPPSGDLGARDRPGVSEDPEVIAAEARLNGAVIKYNEMSAQLDAARLEYATAQAAFKYKYVTVSEPEIPNGAFKPKRGMLTAASWGVALLLGFLAGAVKDLLSARLLESWQVRRLGIDVLAELDLEDRPHT